MHGFQKIFSTLYENRQLFSACTVASHPVGGVLQKKGSDDLVMAGSLDRLSRVPGHLQGLATQACCDVWTAFTEVNVVARVVGWDPDHPPEDFYEAAFSSWHWPDSTRRWRHGWMPMSCWRTTCERRQPCSRRCDSEHCTSPCYCLSTYGGIYLLARRWLPS